MHTPKTYSYAAVLLALALLAFSCSSTRMASGGGKKPEWVVERPVQEGYYIGIGMASTNQDNYLKIAKNNALTDLTSEISVNISSNSILHQLEDQSGFREEFESYTRTSLKDHLEGYELVDSYTGENNHWVFYRLSKEKYRRQKQQKLEKARELAKNFYLKAHEARSSYKIPQAVNYYVKAFQAIKPHLDQDLSVFVMNRGRINLGNTLYQDIQELFSNITIEPQQDVFKIQALSGSNQPVKARVLYTGNGESHRVANLPVVCSFPESNIRETEKLQSDASGTITCSLASMAPKGQRQRIKAALDTEAFFGKKAENPILYKLFSAESSTPYSYLNVEVQDLRAYFKAEEKSFGKGTSDHPVTNLLRQALTRNFFSLVEEPRQADVIVKVSATTTKGKFMEKYNLYTAYLNCNISLINARNQTKVYSTGLQNIKGMKTGGYEMAARDARTKAANQIQEKILPEIRKLQF